MDIERVNENTLKLFISYRDIEDRGYSKEEIWYNRAKGEELFWDMIGEINTEEYFDLEGPIWIHVNASEQGLEVIVTRANFNSDGESSLLSGFDENRDGAEHKLKDSMFDSVDEDTMNGNHSVQNIVTYKFKDFDEVIPVAKRLVSFDIPSSLYKYDNIYYVAVDFTDVEEKSKRQNIKAILNEFLTSSKMTIYRLQEYGEEIMQDRCFETVIQYFD
ncbi:adapter protein mecA [Ureibacillus massiliensis 4400831 = CIP 108448 = CCUG 49529]|uniref:Adapter protein MecA n=2 Tax=cellular organisms TaxID=131567 RepID=A0A0A3J0S8_9BACL|nr:adaptor protein MecA [Ureibacillus massiliensis]KGR90571.1 adapter protein mecA [Ureibacillus massiliensis 4400831 = CIP 108448 = CCUG 49529]RKJ59849.1 adaptor protein MecA [Butyricicoccus sp. 1XD8-22]